eukprot:c17220_g1_i1 orf=704-1138(-)
MVHLLPLVVAVVVPAASQPSLGSLPICSGLGYRNEKVVAVKASHAFQVTLMSTKICHKHIRVSSVSSQIYGSSKSCKIWSSFPSIQPHRSLAGVARCEQANDGGVNSLGIWLGRAAMLGFVATLAVEIVTGKGLLEVTELAVIK